jgi:hypothetical protein
MTPLVDNLISIGIVSLILGFIIWKTFKWWSKFY